MHIIIGILVIIISYAKGDWENWEKYYPTMLYTSLSSFVYEFISHSHFHLWELEKSLFSLMGVHFIHNLIINPLICFVFLSKFPDQFRHQMIYYAEWVILFLAAEWIASHFSILTYHNGWNLWWSFLFILIMFPMIRLHYIHKLRALILSVIISASYLFLFDYL